MVNLFYKSTQARQSAYNKQRSKDLINQLKQKEKIRALNEQEQYNEEVANQLSGMYSKLIESNESNTKAILAQLKGRKAPPSVSQSLLQKIGMTTAMNSPKVDEIREVEAMEPNYFRGDKVDEIRPAQSTVRRYPMQYKADETRPAEVLRQQYPLQAKEDETRPATAIAPQTLSTIEETIKKLQDSARADRLLREQTRLPSYNRGRYLTSRELLMKGKKERGIRQTAKQQKENLIRSNQIQNYASTLQQTRERRQNLARDLQNYLALRRQPQQNVEAFLSASESVMDSLSPRSNRSDIPILEDIDSPRVARSIAEDVVKVIDSPELRNAIARANFAKRSVEKKRRQLINRVERAIRDTEAKRDDVLSEMQQVYDSPPRIRRQTSTATSPTATTASLTTNMEADAKSPPRGPHLSTMKKELKEWYSMYPQEKRYPSLRSLTTAQVNAEISRLQSKYNLEAKGRGIARRNARIQKKSVANRRY